MFKHGEFPQQTVELSEATLSAHFGMIEFAPYPSDFGYTWQVQ